MKVFLKRTVPLFYFLAVSLPHHPFSNWLDEQVLIPAGMATVQHFANIVSIALCVGVFSFSVRVIQIHRESTVKYFLVSIVVFGLMFVADWFLIVNNIERIHYPQYAMLALLLSLSLHNFALIFCVSSFAGFIDEFLQFVVNPDRTNYLDFNDIVLNALGAALGVILLIGLRRHTLTTASSYERYFGLVFFSVASIFIVLTLAGLALGRIVAVADQVKERQVFAVVDEKLSFIMSFERHDQFWMRSPLHGKRFHVFSPLEGLSTIVVLSSFFWWSIKWLDGVRRPREEKDFAGALPPDG